VSFIVRRQGDGMPQEVRLWSIGKDDQLFESAQCPLDLEARLEKWLARDISILFPDLLVIGRQVKTAFGGLIDLLCIDPVGDLVIVELKRDKTPREITAQTLDYASWVSDLSHDEISAIAKGYLGNADSLKEAFKQRFQEDLPDVINDGHRMLIVASKIDASSERIIKYLSNRYGVNINAVTFHYFKKNDGDELLARVFLINPTEVEVKSASKKARTDRPDLMRWADETGHDLPVNYWKDVLVEATTKALKLGLPTSTLPMHHEQTANDDSFNAARQVASDLFIETNASAETIRDWVSKMLLHLGKPKGFLQVFTASEKTFDLPNDG
jgi:hypothetical protein